MSDMTETPSDTPQTGTWLTLEDAARFLKVTVRTIDRRGLVKRRLPNGRAEVWVPGATSDDASDEPETPVAAHEQALAVSERVSDMVRQNAAPLLEALERSEARARALERELGAAEEQKAALLRVVEIVRQMSDADRRDADAARHALEERAAAAEAQAAERAAELERLRERRWWRWW